MYSLRLGSWQSCESSVKIHPRPKIQKLYWRAATIVDMALIKCWRAGTDFGVTTGPRQKKLPRALDILSRLGCPKEGGDVEMLCVSSKITVSTRYI